MGPGVVTSDLHKAAEKVGMFYPPDPASSAMSLIGGKRGHQRGRAPLSQVRRHAGLYHGPRSRDGRRRDILKTGSRAVKDVTGYDLTHLICGSEGTLGVITQITTKLIPNPKPKKRSSRRSTRWKAQATWYRASSGRESFRRLSRSWTRRIFKPSKT